MEGVSFPRKQPRAHQRRPEPHLEPPCRPQTALSEARRSPFEFPRGLFGCPRSPPRAIRDTKSEAPEKRKKKHKKKTDILTHCDPQNRPRLGPDAATTISQKVTHPPCENLDFDSRGWLERARKGGRNATSEKCRKMGRDADPFGNHFLGVSSCARRSLQGPRAATRAMKQFDSTETPGPEAAPDSRMNSARAARVGHVFEQVQRPSRRPKSRFSYGRCVISEKTAKSAPTTP